MGSPYKVYIKPLFSTRIRTVPFEAIEKNVRLPAQIHPLAALNYFGVFKISLYLK